MKRFKYILLGSIIGSLISGGVFSWAAIQSEVGINAFNSTTLGWVKIVGSTTAHDATLTSPFPFAASTQTVLWFPSYSTTETTSFRIPRLVPMSNLEISNTSPFDLTNNYALPVDAILYYKEPSSGDIRTASNIVVPSAASQVPVFGLQSNASQTAIITVAIPTGARDLAGTISNNYDAFFSQNNSDDNKPVMPTGRGGGLATIAYNYVFDGTTWDRWTGAITATSTGNVTPADAFANPTTAQTTFSLNGVWNGTTWDRSRSNTTEIDGLVGFSTGVQVIQTIPREFNTGGSYDRIRHSFFQSTTGITTNAVGTTLDITTTPASNFTMIVDRTAGATNVVGIYLQCSIDGTIWPTADGISSLAFVTDLTAEPVAVGNVDLGIQAGGRPKACRFIRYNVTTVGAGNTLTIQILASGR